MKVRIIRNIFLAAIVMLSVSCQTTMSRCDIPKGFVADVLLPITPIKDQGNTELCWIYAMLATLETDCLVMGDSVNLSPLWCARKSMEEQCRRTFFSGDSISLRGTLPEALSLIERYGLMTYNSYKIVEDSSPSLRMVARSLFLNAKSLSVQRASLSKLTQCSEEILDSYISPAPHRVFLYGMDYSPTLFAESVSVPGKWLAVTSFLHHPYNTRFDIEIPDNRQHHMVLNVQTDTLMSYIDGSLYSRHPVAWEGCMKRLGDNPKYVSGDVSSLRQMLFEKHVLTDDHCMTIIGFGHAVNGKKYYILKNSWGEGNGLMYLSERDMMLSTIMVMLRKDIM